MLKYNWLVVIISQLDLSVIIPIYVIDFIRECVTFIPLRMIQKYYRINNNGSYQDKWPGN